MQTHGNATWRAEGRILYCSMQGPFNLEAIAELPRDLKRFRITTDGKCWGVVCVPLGDSLFTPDAELAFSEVLKRFHDDRCRVVAYALSGMPWPHVFERQIKRIYASSGIQLHLVSDTSEAVRLVEATLRSCRA